jgi:hypothetical protein
VTHKVPLILESYIAMKKPIKKEFEYHSKLVEETLGFSFVFDFWYNGVLIGPTWTDNGDKVLDFLTEYKILYYDFYNDFRLPQTTSLKDSIFTMVAAWIEAHPKILILESPFITEDLSEKIYDFMGNYLQENRSILNGQREKDKITRLELFQYFQKESLLP